MAKEIMQIGIMVTSYKQCKMQQNNTGSRLSENQENRAETDIILLYKQMQNYMQMNSNMT